MFNLIKKYRKRKLKKLQSISRGLASVLSYIEDDKKSEIGYKN